MNTRDDDLMQGRTAAPQTPADAEIERTEAVRSRQLSRAKVMALLLGAFVVLVFAISIVKITQGYGP